MKALNLKLGVIQFIGILGFCLPLLILTPIYALQLPDADLKELQLATQTIEVVLESLRQGMVLLVLLLAISLAVNFLLITIIWRAQEQVKLSLELVKQTDVVKASLEKLLSSTLSLKGHLEPGGDKPDLGEDEFIRIRDSSRNKA